MNTNAVKTTIFGKIKSELDDELLNKYTFFFRLTTIIIVGLCEKVANSHKNHFYDLRTSFSDKCVNSRTLLMCLQKRKLYCPKIESKHVNIYQRKWLD